MRLLPSFLSRRRAAVALVAFACIAANAQSSSQRPIRLVVPFGPGGVADLTARVVARKMTQDTGQNIIVDNKPGAGGIVAAEAVATAAPDGLTLLLMSNANAVSAGLFKALPFDPIKSFAPVSMLGYFDMAVIVGGQSQFTSMEALLAYAKAHPGQLNIATINTGSTQNLAAELLKRSLKIDAQIVPFNSSASVLTALQGNQVDAAVEILAPILGQVQGKTLRALAVMGEKRAPQFPSVPTVSESGAPGFNVASWNALAAPAKTPAGTLARLNKAVNDALNSADVKKQLADIGVQPKPSTPQQQADFYAGEIRRWSAVIRDAGIPQQ